MYARRWIKQRKDESHFSSSTAFARVKSMAKGKENHKRKLFARAEQKSVSSPRKQFRTLRSARVMRSCGVLKWLIHFLDELEPTSARASEKWGINYSLQKWKRASVKKRRALRRTNNTPQSVIHMRLTRVRERERWKGGPITFLAIIDPCVLFSLRTTLKDRNCLSFCLEFGFQHNNYSSVLFNFFRIINSSSTFWSSVQTVLQMYFNNF